EKEPARRYADEQTLAEDVRRYGANEPIKARRVGAIERLVKWSRRNRGMAMLTGAVAALLIVGSLVAWGLAGWALNEAGRADQEAELATTKENEAIKQTGIAKENETEATKQKLLAEDAAKKLKKENE